MPEEGAGEPAQGPVVAQELGAGARVREQEARVRSARAARTAARAGGVGETEGVGTASTLGDGLGEGDPVSSPVTASKVSDGARTSPLVPASVASASATSVATPSVPNPSPRVRTTTAAVPASSATAANPDNHCCIRRCRLPPVPAGPPTAPGPAGGRPARGPRPAAAAAAIPAPIARSFAARCTVAAGMRGAVASAVSRVAARPARTAGSR